MVTEVSPSRTFDALVARFASRARRNVPLGVYSTYRVGGPAGLLLEVQDEADLKSISSLVSEHDSDPIPFLVIGKGSNLLISDAGFPGLVILLGRGFSRIEIQGVRVSAGAATGLPVLARRSVTSGLTGLEWAVGVPGSVGGAVRMNAGGHGAETAQVLDSCRVVDLVSGAVDDRSTEALAFSYRHSALGTSEVVTAATFVLAPGDRATSEAKLAEIVRWRRAHQPGGSNAGSVFTNPPGDAAGRLIDEAGLKGFRLGTAQVSSKHANFIQADDGGSGDDVRRVIDHVRDIVEKRFGVLLVPEVCLIGFRDSPPAPTLGGHRS